MDRISETLNLEPLSSDTLDYIYADLPKTMTCQRGEMNAFYGQRHTEESKKLMSESAKKRGSNRTGTFHTEETKQKIREKAIGRPSPRKGVDPWNKGIATSEETKKKISESKKGKPRDAETKRKLSEARKNAPKLTCPHCGKQADSANYKRWHGDNCKSK